MAMMELSRKADIYLFCMNTLADERSKVLDSQDNQQSACVEQVALLEAQWAFAKDCFLELSAQANEFYHKLGEIEAKLPLLAFESGQLYAQIDREMREGQLAKNVPAGEYLHYR